jgi:hypothetical protein
MNALKVQKKICTKLVTQILERQRSQILGAVEYLGLPPEQAGAVESALISILGRLPQCIAQLDAIEGLFEDIQKGMAFTNPLKLLDNLIKIARKIMGPQVCRGLFLPYAETLVSPLLATLESVGVSDGARAECKALTMVLAQYVVGHGIGPLVKKWATLDWSKLTGGGGEGEEQLASAKGLLEADVRRAHGVEDAGITMSFDADDDEDDDSGPLTTSKGARR